MISDQEAVLRGLCQKHGQEHVFRFWEGLNDAERRQLLGDLDQVDFPLMTRLAQEWILNKPAQEVFNHIAPVPVIPRATPDRPDAKEARLAGEQALRDGRVGLFLVAGGQGTRLGFNGPKGSYPIGPMTQKTLFQYHAEKIRNLQQQYGCVLPWYIMVSEANAPATKAYFEKEGHFGLSPEDVIYIPQRMVPCMDEQGRFMLETKSRLSMNPNGHGGCIPAMVENDVLQNAHQRGVTCLSYFQVDNWAVKLADPYFIGYHVLRNAEMSSKVHRKDSPREAVGVHCLCDGVYRVVEYSELDLYPQLLETDAEGKVVYFAGNPAMHIMSVDFVQRLYDRFDLFPWHLAHKKIAFIDGQGRQVKPDQPNGYKFETFVFDALRFAAHAPVALEIDREGEYTPTKQFEGDNSVVAARRRQANYWGGWLEAAGCILPRDAAGNVTIPVEISPAWALDKQQFLDKFAAPIASTGKGISIDEDGGISVL